MQVFDPSQYLVLPRKSIFGCWQLMLWKKVQEVEIAKNFLELLDKKNFHFISFCIFISIKLCFLVIIIHEYSIKKFCFPYFEDK
jgi:hypothetical protein